MSYLCSTSSHRTVWVMLLSPSSFCGVVAPSYVEPSPSPMGGGAFGAFTASSFWVVLPSPLHPLGWCDPSSRRSYIIHFNSMTKSNQAVRYCTTSKKEEGEQHHPEEGGAFTPSHLFRCIPVLLWCGVAVSCWVVLLSPLYPFGWCCFPPLHRVGWHFDPAFICVVLLSLLLRMWCNVCSSTGSGH